MESIILQKEYTIHVYEIGPDGKINLYSLFDFLQDIASEHAVKLGYGRTELMKRNQYWVLSRIYAVIHELPSWGDKIVVITWPKGTDRVFALRDYEVFYSDGRPVASATSSWLIIDLITKKIQRPDNVLAWYNSEVARKDSLSRNAARLEPVSADSRIVSNFNVKISDLDINLHTNNVKYIKWVTDTYDIGFVMNNAPFSAEINYLSESRFNDNILIRTSEEMENDKVFNNSIVRLPDNTELCRIRIGWKKNYFEKKTE